MLNKGLRPVTSHTMKNRPLSHQLSAVRFKLLFSVICLLSSGAAALAASFDIPAQPAPAALDLFIKQSGAQVVYLQADVKDVRTNAVKGDYPPAAALEILLKDTGLSHSERKAGQFSVGRIPPKTGSIRGALAGEGGKGLAGVLVTVRETTQSAETDRYGEYVFPKMAAGTYVLVASAPGYQPLHITDVAVKAGRELTIGKEEMRKAKEGPLALEPFVVHADTVTELDKFEVTGTKAAPFSGARIDVPRTRDDAVPFSTYTAQDIEYSGATNLDDFFRMRLPQNFAAVIPEEGNGNLNVFAASYSSLNLRGWDGSSEILILVNGRRLPVQRLASSSTTDANPLFGNFRGIPLGSIERIEVLSSAGSAIYGAGATGGVINVITKQDYSGGELTLNYQNPLDAHAPKRSFELTSGMPLAAGLSLRLGLGYAESLPLNVEDRADVTTLRWRRLIMERNPARITGDFTPPVGATPNIKASGPLFGTGTTTFTSVPDGYAGGQGITPFLDRQGLYNLGLSEGIGNFGNTGSRQATLGTASRDTNLSLGLDKTLGTDWHLSLEYRYTKNATTGKGSNRFTYFNLTAASPNNPFGRTVRVAWDDPRLARPELIRRTTARAHEVTLTLRGSTGEWRELFDFTYTNDRNTRVIRVFDSPLGDMTLDTLGRWSAVLLSGAYNPLVDMRTVAPAAPSFYEEYVQAQDEYASGSVNYQASAKASGPLGRLPAGSVQWTVGAEWLREDRNLATDFSRYVNSKTGLDLIPQTTGDQSSRLFVFDTFAAYTEANVPVLAAGQSVPLIRRLDLFASGRSGLQINHGFKSDGTPVEYRTSPYLYMAGLRHEIFEGVMLRASRSIGFKPPLLGQVASGTPPDVNSTVIDRRRNDQSRILLPAQYLTGGNPDLKPETTNSTNVGLILTPRWAKGLRLSADYVDSIRDDAITLLTTQNVVDLEADGAMAGRIVRAAPETGAPNGVGLITFVDARNINFSQTRSKSLDLTVEQHFEKVFGGRLVFTAAASKNISFKVQASSTSVPVEQVRTRITTFSSQLRWNANGQIRWEGRQWTFGWSTRFYDSVLALPALFIQQGGDRAPWEFEHDAFVGYRFGRKEQPQPRGPAGLLADTTITLGVRNVFDREPRFWAAGNYVSFDSIYGRNVWLQVKKSF